MFAVGIRKQKIVDRSVSEEKCDGTLIVQWLVFVVDKKRKKAGRLLRYNGRLHRSECCDSRGRCVKGRHFHSGHARRQYAVTAGFSGE